MSWACRRSVNPRVYSIVRQWVWRYCPAPVRKWRPSSRYKGHIPYKPIDSDELKVWENKQALRQPVKCNLFLTNCQEHWQTLISGWQFRVCRQLHRMSGSLRVEASCAVKLITRLAGGGRDIVCCIEQDSLTIWTLSPDRSESISRSTSASSFCPQDWVSVHLVTWFHFVHTWHLTWDSTQPPSRLPRSCKSSQDEMLYNTLSTG